MSIHTTHHATKLVQDTSIDLNMKAKLRKVLEGNRRGSPRTGASKVSAKVIEEKSWQIKIYSLQNTPLRKGICININNSSIKLFQKDRQEGGGNR